MHLRERVLSRRNLQVDEEMVVSYLGSDHFWRHWRGLIAPEFSVLGCVQSNFCAMLQFPQVGLLFAAVAQPRDGVVMVQAMGDSRRLPIRV